MSIAPVILLLAESTLPRTSDRNGWETLNATMPIMTRRPSPSRALRYVLRIACRGSRCPSVLRSPAECTAERCPGWAAPPLAAVAPASSMSTTRGPRRNGRSRRRHHGVFTRSASSSELPQRLQNLRTGGLPSPHCPQMRSPGRSLRVGLVFVTAGASMRAACGARSGSLPVASEDAAFACPWIGATSSLAAPAGGVSTGAAGGDGASGNLGGCGGGGGVAAAAAPAGAAAPGRGGGGGGAGRPPPGRGGGGG